MGTGSPSVGAGRHNIARQSSANTGLPAAASLEPLLAGAQARGMADMLELQGLGCILISADGRVLFVSDRAGTILKGTIVKAAGHLAGTTHCARTALGRLLASTLAGETGREVIATESHAIELRSYLPAGDKNSDAQLLHAIVAVKKMA